MSILKALNGRISADQVYTYAAEFIVLIGTVLLYRIAGARGESELDNYVIVRRYISFFQPLILVGIAVGLTRYVALASTSEEQVALFKSAASVVIVIALGLCAVFFAIPEWVAEHVFASVDLAPLVPPTGVMLVGLVLHSVVYSYWRGCLAMGIAGVSQVLALAAIPIAAFMLFTELHTILLATGVAWLLSALLFTLPIPLRRSKGLKKSLRSKLIRFGLPRLPGDFALVGLLTLPVFFATVQAGVAGGGKLGFAITLLNVMGAAMAPIAILMLPQASLQIAEGKYAELRTKTRDLALLVFAGTAVLTLAFYFSAEWVLTSYLGEIGRGHIQVSRLVFFAAPAFAYFLAMRSLIDAFYQTPQNGINQLKALLVLLVGIGLCSLFKGDLVVLACVLVFAMYYLAFATCRTVSAIHRSLGDLEDAEEDAELRVLVVIPDKEESNGYPFSRRQAAYMKDELAANVEVFYLESRTSFAGVINAASKFKKVQRSFDPDVVQVHYGSVSAFFTILFSKAPVVVTFLGSDLNPTPSDGRLRDFIGRTLSQISAYFASGIICVSENLRERLWWRRDEALIAPLGADLNVFFPQDRDSCRAELGWDISKDIVLFNANNPGVKRLDIAEKAVELVRESLDPVHLEKLSGRIPFEKIPKLLNAADVLLLCSDSEGSPSMIKEAMACNLPVVATDVGDVKQRLEGVEPGGIYPQTAESLAQGILEVLRGKRISNGRSMAGRNRADVSIVDREVLDHLRKMTFRR